VVKSATVAVSDGSLDIEFIHRTENPMLAGIEILPSGTQPSEPAPPTEPPQLGSVTLDWTPPTKNTDGSALKNLTGYRILYGQGALTKSVTVGNVSSYTVRDLEPGLWSFAVVALSSTGESVASNPVSAQ